MIERFSNLLAVNFEVEVIDNRHDEVLAQISTEQPYILKRDTGELSHIYAVESDVWGKPAILIKADVPTVITAKGAVTATKRAIEDGRDFMRLCHSMTSCGIWS